MGKTPYEGGEKHEYVTKPEGKGKTSALPGCCQHAGCKTSVHRFGFCTEHYEQFKFGLIKKTGEHVSDYEKKYDHYVAYKARISARKVA